MKRNKSLAMAVFCSALLLGITFAASVYASENWQEENVVGSWETAIDINGDSQAVVTRVALNTQRDTAIKLRELMAGLGYDVKWNGEGRHIELRNNGSYVRIYIDSDYCERNGVRIDLDGAVFISDDYSYCSLSFLQNVLGVEAVQIDRAETNNRINGIALKAPELSASSRKPFPETTLYVDGAPLYIDYAESLMESLPYDSVFLTCDGINGQGEKVIIYSEAMLRDFKISKVRYNDTGNVFREDSIILPPRDIAPPLVVELNTTVPEGVPVEAITFTDSKGKTLSYLLGYNGKDGSVFASEVTFN